MKMCIEVGLGNLRAEGGTKIAGNCRLKRPVPVGITECRETGSIGTFRDLPMQRASCTWEFVLPGEVVDVVYIFETQGKQGQRQQRCVSEVRDAAEEGLDPVPRKRPFIGKNCPCAKIMRRLVLLQLPLTLSRALNLTLPSLVLRSEQ